MSSKNETVVDLFNPKLDKALEAWHLILPEARIITGDALEAYDNCPSQAKRRVRAALLPITQEEIQAIIVQANTYKIPLYPISTGKNWGYGGANPFVDNCVIVDLSQMNKILDFNDKLGIITIEPGVTQGQLSDFLIKNNHPYMISTIVAGPNCSYIGNALERGFGMIPPRDRFLSMTALKAVLPNGEPYQSLIADAGSETTDQVYKWGVGPYLDGLFSQGSFGIVTQASFALARIPEQITRFYFSPKRNIPLAVLIDHLREAKQILRDVMNSFEFGNRTAAIYEEGNNDCSTWMVYGSLHTTKRVGKAVIADLKSILKPAFEDFVFITPEKLKHIESYPFAYKYSKNWRYIVKNIDKIIYYMDLYKGIPDMGHLEYAFTGNENINKDTDYEAAMKETGYIAFQPIIPLNGTDMTAFIDMMKRVSKEHDFEPGMDISIASETHIIARISIFFNPKTETTRAQNYHKALFDGSKALGFLPCRAHIDTIKWFTDSEQSTHSKVISALKTAIDPHNIMAPGRF